MNVELLRDLHFFFFFNRSKDGCNGSKTIAPSHWNLIWTLLLAAFTTKKLSISWLDLNQNGNIFFYVMLRYITDKIVIVGQIDDHIVSHRDKAFSSRCWMSHFCDIFDIRQLETYNFCSVTSTSKHLLLFTCRSRWWSCYDFKK